MSNPVRDKKVILVTGGTGLVGNAIKWATLRDDPLFGRNGNEEWAFVSSKDGDLRDYHAARKIFNESRPDQVIHLAARVGGMFENMRRPAQFATDNLAIDQNVLRLCHEFQVRKLVSCLSTCIFPDKVQYPINETMLHDGPPHDSNFAYAHAKRMLEVSSRAYRRQFGCQFVTVIPTNIYGPHDNFGEGCHFVPAIIKRVVEAKARQGGGGGGGDKDRDIVITGTGQARRQFIYSRDLARLIIFVLRHYNDDVGDSAQPLILSVDPAHEVTIRDVVEAVCAESGYRGAVTWIGDTQADGQLRKTADNARLKELLRLHMGEGGDSRSFELTGLRKGLAESIQWYEESREYILSTVKGDSKL